MGRKEIGTARPMSIAIIDVVRDLLGESGEPATKFFTETGISSNYWYVRMRYAAPFNTNDIETIADHFNIDPLEIYAKASARLETKSRTDEERIKSTLQKLQRGDMSLAALHDPHKKIEMNGAEFE